MGSSGVPVMAGGKMKQLLEKQAPWSQLTALRNIVVQERKDGDFVQIDPQVKVTFIEVPHRNEFSETFAFLIEGPKKKLLYVPDIDRWDEWNYELHNICSQVDICLLDGTFYSGKELEHIGRDFREIPHPHMTETMDRLQDLAEQKEIYFIHINHSNPAIHENCQVRDMIESRGFILLRMGWNSDCSS
ncbi:MBL fold metallo-hydrolase [Bacillus sp. N9]